MKCWTALDVYLMQEIVAVLPLISISIAQVIPKRVVSYSYDRTAGSPALDRIAVQH
jgi:hypothetical protein